MCYSAVSRNAAASKATLLVFFDFGGFRREAAGIGQDLMLWCFLSGHQAALSIGRPDCPKADFCRLRPYIWPVAVKRGALPAVIPAGGGALPEQKTNSASPRRLKP